jgi:hypothetical protein
MFGNGQLTRRQQHKAALLQQSATHRSVLAQEAHKLRPVAEWADLGIAVARKARTGWTALAPLLSLWQARKQGSFGFAWKLAGAIAIARSLTAVWKRWC